MLEPIIKTLKPKKLVGFKTEMSLVDNKTHQLWATFMPRRKEISNHVDDHLFSLQVYGENHFEKFNLHNIFQKYALAEVSDYLSIPEGMLSYDLEGGMYAVFHHKGLPDPNVFQYIYGKWIPNSQYMLDNRPHFELLGPKYRNNDPTSEEDIWIPIK